MTDLIDVLQARTGIVCAIGAGGKKTTMYALARRHPGRVAITATVHIPLFPEGLAERVIEPEERLDAGLANVAGLRRIAYACPANKPDRHAGVAAGLIRRLHEAHGFDLTLVKADGARMRWIKAPNAGEPVLPPATDTILVLVSARALGQRLGERIAHRPKQVSAVTGARLGGTFTPEHMARLLTRPEGLLTGIGSGRVIPVINMVEDAEREELARQAAEAALEATSRFDRVVLARMRDESDPVVAVVRR